MPDVLGTRDRVAKKAARFVVSQVQELHQARAPEVPVVAAVLHEERDELLLTAQFNVRHRLPPKEEPASDPSLGLTTQVFSLSKYTTLRQRALCLGARPPYTTKTVAGSMPQPRHTAIL